MGVGGPTQWCHKSPLPSQAPQGAPSTTSKVWRACQVQENPKRPKGEPWGSLGKPKSLGRGQGILPGWGGGSGGARKGLDPGLSVPPPGIAKAWKDGPGISMGLMTHHPPSKRPGSTPRFPWPKLGASRKGFLPATGTVSSSETPRAGACPHSQTPEEGPPLPSEESPQAPAGLNEGGEGKAARIPWGSPQPEVQRREQVTPRHSCTCIRAHAQVGTGLSAAGGQVGGS